MIIQRIAILSEDISPPLDEGFKKATYEIAAAMAARRRTTVFAASHGDVPFELGNLPSNKLLLGGDFSRRLRRVDCDVILYIPKTSATLSSLARARLIGMQSGGKPVVVLSLQRRTFPDLAKILISFLRPSLALVLSAGSRAIMQEAGIPAKRVPLGVNTGRFRPPEPGEKERLKEKYGLGRGRIALHVGHISARRNLGLLKKLPLNGAVLALVTSTSTAREPGVREWLSGESVIMMDEYIENIEEVYRLADCYVFPTLDVKGAIEIPLSVLEAMATNLPVVTTAFGGIPDLFREGEGLFVCRSETECMEKFARAMALDVAATRNLVEELTWGTVADEILKAIQQETA